MAAAAHRGGGVLADRDQDGTGTDTGVNQGDTGVEGGAESSVQPRHHGHPGLGGVLTGDVGAGRPGRHDQVHDTRWAVHGQGNAVGPTGHRAPDHRPTASRDVTT